MFWRKTRRLGKLSIDLIRNDFAAAKCPIRFMRTTLDHIENQWFLTIRIRSFYIDVDWS